jgi:hypothetical protein
VTRLVGAFQFGRYVFLMDPNVSTLEADALAASGRFHKMADIRIQLHREGYNHALVQGPALTKQLIDAMEQAHQRKANGAHAQKKAPAKKP